MKRPITLVRLFAAVVCLGGLATVATIAREEQPAADQMADAAQAFLDSLTPEQRKKAEFGYDDPHRLGWFFTPQQDKAKNFTRKGVRLEELNEEQQKKALALLKSGTSAKGYEQATTIMSLEGILKDAEKNSGAMVRNQGWYFVSVFGKPSKTGQWGWRLEGHHMSVNFTLNKGVVEAPTPFMFGANPATIPNGPKKGFKTIPEVEDAVRELIASLDADQKKVAFQGTKHFPEIAENTPAAKIGEPVGIQASKFNEKQQAALVKLLEAYTNRMPASVATAEMKAVKDAGLEKIYFGYTGDTEPGKGYTYRVHGPTFVAQFLNIQADGFGNANNHIHSSWRRLPSDFGLMGK